MANEEVPRRGQAVSRAQLARNRANGLKHCFACKQTKPLEEFGNEKTRSDGRSPRCRECVRQDRLRRIKRFPDAEGARSARRRAEQPDKVNADTRRRYHSNVELSRELNRRKRAEHPERYAEIARRYREKNRERCNEGSRLRKRQVRAEKKANGVRPTEAERAKEREWHRQYHRRNREAINARARASRKLRVEIDPDFVERRRQSSRKYHAANKEVVRAIRRNRKARVRQAEGRHSADDVFQILKQQRGRCANPKCRKMLKDDFHADHIVPIALGGNNGRRNIQLMCGRCNQRKHAKHPLTWARENGLLL